MYNLSMYKYVIGWFDGIVVTLRSCTDAIIGCSSLYVYVYIYGSQHRGMGRARKNAGLKELTRGI